MQELFTIKEVAQILKVDPKTVYKYVWSGKLKSKKLGKTHRISKEDLEAFINGKG